MFEKSLTKILVLSTIIREQIVRKGVLKYEASNYL